MFFLLSSRSINSTLALGSRVLGRLVGYILGSTMLSRFSGALLDEDRVSGCFGLFEIISHRKLSISPLVPFFKLKL